MPAPEGSVGRVLGFVGEKVDVGGVSLNTQCFDRHVGRQDTSQKIVIL